MCIEYLCYLHPPMPFPYFLPSSTGSNSPRQDLFCLPVPQFCKWKTKKSFVCLR
jgi:hypothetical protein